MLNCKYYDYIKSVSDNITNPDEEIHICEFTDFVFYGNFNYIEISYPCFPKQSNSKFANITKNIKRNRFVISS